MNSECNNRGVAIFSESSFDRSPCGSGTSAMMAMLFEKGKLIPNEEFRNESIIGTEFRGRIIDTLVEHGSKSIVPEITASAYITGESLIHIDSQDPYKYGIDFKEL